MPTRGERLQEIFDLGRNAVAGASHVRALRDLYGPYVNEAYLEDQVKTVLGRFWDLAQDVIQPILETLRCNGCPMCVPGEDRKVTQACAFASFDAVEAFKDGARTAVWERFLARIDRGMLALDGGV